MSYFITVPRKVAKKYWHRPWSEVVAAAERGEDGLVIGPPTRADEVAVLQKADTRAWGHPDKTILFQQKW